MTLSDLIEDYYERGKTTFTKEEVLEDSKISMSSFYSASKRLQDKKKIFKPKQGFYVIVRSEDRKMGAPPAKEFIDHLMNYLDEPYYVGVLPAAQIHGSAHHAPQVFQVVTENSLNDIEQGRQPIEFIKNKNLDVVPVDSKKTRTGYINVSTPEATVVDTIFYHKRAGGMDNAANIIIELSEDLEPSELFQAAVNMHDTATVQRLGYVLSEYGFRILAKPLESWIEKQDVSRTPLIPGGKRSGVRHDKRWHVLVNHELDPDVI